MISLLYLCWQNISTMFANSYPVLGTYKGQNSHTGQSTSTA